MAQIRSVVVVWAGVLGLLLFTQPRAVQARQSATRADSARQEKTSLPDSGAARRGPTDPRELEAFFDGMMASDLRDHHIAGAVVAVVRDSTILFQKGYGYADVATRQPVDPARTLFRVGSISKLLTWTAVMQLVEEGRLDLDTDVNRYIDFTIPATYPQPITLRHLLTHTPGFEDRFLGLFAASDIPLHDWMVRNLPARVRPPGILSAYSNYGAGLAGYIVARTAGVSWDDYIEAHILTPLGMQHTTGRQPLPAALAPDMSKGYQWQGGRFVEKPFETIGGGFAAAGSVSATAADMARFMIAHLQDGRYGDTRILGAATARLMHARAFAHDDRLNGFALGFYEKSANGLRIIGHSGDTELFHSDLALIPSEHVGLFVSNNTAGGGAVTFGPFLAAFLDHYYPVQRPQLAFDSTADLSRFVGAYRSDRRSYTTFEKVTALFSDQKIHWDHHGHLTMALPGEGHLRAVQVGPDLFQDEQTGTRIAFREDDQGRVTDLFADIAPMMAFIRDRGIEQPGFQLTVLMACIVLFASVVITAPVRWLLGRRFRDLVPVTGSARRARRIALLMALLFVVFLLGFAAVAGTATATLAMGRTGVLAVVLGLGVAGALVTIPVLIYALRAWLNGWWRWPGRVHYSVIALAGVVFIWFLNHWNLLGWRY